MFMDWLKIVKTTVFLKVVYEFNKIPSKFQSFTKLEKGTLKFI